MFIQLVFNLKGNFTALLLDILAPNIGNPAPWDSTLRREKSCIMKRCKRLSNRRGRSGAKGG